MRTSILLALLLGACANHENGCEGSDAERYAKVIDPQASCFTIKYGNGNTPDYGLCSVAGKDEQWFCQSHPDTCWPLGPVIKVGRLP